MQTFQDTLTNSVDTERQKAFLTAQSNEKLIMRALVALLSRSLPITPYTSALQVIMMERVEGNHR